MTDLTSEEKAAVAETMSTIDIDRSSGLTNAEIEKKLLDEATHLTQEQKKQIMAEADRAAEIAEHMNTYRPKSRRERRAEAVMQRRRDKRTKVINDPRVRRVTFMDNDGYQIQLPNGQKQVLVGGHCYQRTIDKLKELDEAAKSATVGA